MNSNLSQESDWQEVADLALFSWDTFPWPMSCFDWSLLQRRRNEVGADWRRLSEHSFAAWVQQAWAGLSHRTHTPYSDSRSSVRRSSVLAPCPSPQPRQFTHSSLLNERVLAFITETSRTCNGATSEQSPSSLPRTTVGLRADGTRSEDISLHLLLSQSLSHRKDGNLQRGTAFAVQEVKLNRDSLWGTRVLPVCGGTIGVLKSATLHPSSPDRKAVKAKGVHNLLAQHLVQCTDANMIICLFMIIVIVFLCNTIIFLPPRAPWRQEPHLSRLLLYVQCQAQWLAYVRLLRKCLLNEWINEAGL